MNYCICHKRNINNQFLRICNDMDHYFLNDQHLTKLTTLKSNNRFTDRGLLNLTNLTTLNIGRNINFTDIGLSKLTKLTYLNCGCNNTFINNGLVHLINLK